jgi:hypothetical protein
MILISACFFWKPWEDGRTISYDSAGYYLYLPATLIHKDLTKCEFYSSLSEEYRIGDRQSHRIHLENGNVVLKYSSGIAIMMTPGFLAGHLAAIVMNAPIDGYSSPYYLALIFWSIIFSAIGLWYLRKLLLEYFEDISIGLSFLSLILGTNYLIYAGMNNLMSHSFLFTLYALLLWNTHRWHKDNNLKHIIGIGIIIGLLGLSRPTELIAVCIPLFWNVHNKLTALSKYHFIKNNIRHIIYAGIITILIGSFQLIYWKSVSGKWLFYSYSEQGFDFLQPHIFDGLFSFKKGWLIYTPIMILSLLGFYFLYKRTTHIFYSCLAILILSIYIGYSWSIWWYGGSVGSRAMVQYYAVLLIPLTAFYSGILNKSWIKWIVSLFVLICIYLNIMMTWQSHTTGGPWHAEYMSKAYYTRIIGKTSAPKNYKKFLDIKKAYSGEKDGHIIYQNDFENVDSNWQTINSKIVFSGQKGLLLNKENRQSPVIEIFLSENDIDENKWIRVSVHCYFPESEWNEWQQSRVHLQFWRGDENYLSESIRLNWLTETNTWHKGYFEIPVYDAFNEIEATDKLRIYLRHGGGNHQFYADDLTIEIL